MTDHVAEVMYAHALHADAQRNPQRPHHNTTVRSYTYDSMRALCTPLELMIRQLQQGWRSTCSYVETHYCKYKAAQVIT
jgi:hypothetical protein